MTVDDNYHSKHTLPGKWFIVIAILALIWNSMGVMAFISQIMMTAEELVQLPIAEQALYRDIPLWVTVAFACAVFGGAFASLALLMKKTLAVPLFSLSLLGVITQMYHAFVLNNSFEVFGPGGLIMPILVILFAVLLMCLSISAKAKQWLN